MDEHEGPIQHRSNVAFREPKTSIRDGRALLQQLSKFVGKPEQSAEKGEQRSSLQNHLEKRKLMEVNQQTRFNRIMDGFKSLDTFVDVKSLVKEIERIEQEEADPIVNHTPEKPRTRNNIGSERLLAESNESSPYLRLIERANRQIASHQNSYSRRENYQLNDLVVELSKLSRYNQKQLDESYPLDSFQAALYCRLLEDDQASRRLPTSPETNRNAQPLHPQMQIHCSSFHPSKQHPHIDSEYYRKFKQKADLIQSKLHHMLEAMHVAKWKDRQNHAHQTVSPPKRQKPIIDGKYRIHAPKNYFRFRDVDSSLKKFKLLKRQPLTAISSNANSQRNTEAGKPQHLKMLTPHDKSPIRVRRKARGTAPHPHRSHLPSKTFTDMKQLHQNYSFKKPLIKGNILRKIVEFIDGVEKEQFEFRRHNEQMSGHLVRLEANKQADFDRFLQERVDINIEDMQNFCQRDRLI